METTRKLTGKDLLNIGIYTVIYFVIILATAMLGMIPILYLMLVVIAPILGGIPFMLFLTKVKKFGMIWIMSIIMGILMILSGMSWYALAMSVVTGFVSELIYKSGDYKSTKCAVLTCGTFNLWIWANLLLLFANRDYYLTSRTEMIGKEFTDTLNAMTPNWLCPVLLVVCFVSGLIGGLLGKRMLSKHFKKAGMI